MQRVIFTLLYDRGQFMLSRNFRLQTVGSIDWLFSNYDLAEVSHGLDELMILDVSRTARDPARFAQTVRAIAGRCFIPLTVGGGVTTFEVANLFLRNGADKLLLNSSFEQDPALCRTLAGHFGRQCIVAGVDYRRAESGAPEVCVNNGTRAITTDLAQWVNFIQEAGAGEVLLQSMDMDGTGMGPDLAVLEHLGGQVEVPCILMGGVGKAEHLISALRNRRVDAIATANLFNFIGSSFLEARSAISNAGIDVARWNAHAYDELRDKFVAAE